MRGELELVDKVKNPYLSYIPLCLDKLEEWVLISKLKLITVGLDMFIFSGSLFFGMVFSDFGISIH